MNGFRNPGNKTLAGRVVDLSTVVEELDRRVVHAFELLKALDSRLVDVAKTTLAAIDDERAARAAFQTKTLWQRLRWIATGR